VVPPRSAVSFARIVHLDLHPENVMLTVSGPVVIDWRNATDGDPDSCNVAGWFGALTEDRQCLFCPGHPVRGRLLLRSRTCRSSSGGWLGCADTGYLWAARTWTL